MATFRLRIILVAMATISRFPSGVFLIKQSAAYVGPWVVNANTKRDQQFSGILKDSKCFVAQYFTGL